MIYNKNIILEVFNMPRYKLSPEERAAEKERKENLTMNSVTPSMIIATKTVKTAVTAIPKRH